MTPGGALPSRAWGLAGTLLWGGFIAGAFVGAQFGAALLVAFDPTAVTDEAIQRVIDAASTDGTAIAAATLASALVCVPLMLGVAKVKRHSRLRDYFALEPVAPRVLARWLGLLAVFIVVADGLTLALGRSIVPEFMRVVYDSAQPVWLL